MSENRLLIALQKALRLALEHLGLAEAPIHYIGGSDTLPPPLPRDEEDAAIRASPRVTIRPSICSLSTTSDSSSTSRAALRTRASTLRTWCR